MKNIKRLVFGLISSGFLAVGLVQAAERLDPMHRDAGDVKDGALVATTETSGWCDHADHHSN